MISPFVSKRTGLLLLGAVAAGWLLTPLPPEAQSAVQARRDGWHVAELPRRPDLVRATIDSTAAAMWGPAVLNPVKSAAATAVDDPRWRVAGVYGAGSDRQVIITFMNPDKHVQYLRVGDSLPSGHKIESIHDNEVCVRIGKQAHRLLVERLAP